jgi:DNA (cytosine-5)-methyltransferase 1
VFVVGCLGNWRASAAVLFDRHSLSGNPAPSREKGKGIAGSAQRSVGRSGEAEVSGTLCARDYKGVNSDDLNDGKLVILNDQGGSVMNVEKDDIVGTLRSQTHGHEPIIFEPRSPDGVPCIGKDVSPTLNTMGGGQREPCVSQTFAIQGNIIDRADTAGANGKGVKSEQAYTLNTVDRQAVAHTFKIRSGCEGGGKGYLGQDEAAFTLDTTQSQNLMHKTAIRRLTPIECERLQGFPDNFTKIPYRGKSAYICPDGPRYKALGNSMAVPVVHWIGKRLHEINQLLT